MIFSNLKADRYATVLKVSWVVRHHAGARAEPPPTRPAGAPAHDARLYSFLFDSWRRTAHMVQVLGALVTVAYTCRPPDELPGCAAAGRRVFYAADEHALQCATRSAAGRRRARSAVSAATSTTHTCRPAARAAACCAQTTLAGATGTDSRRPEAATFRGMWGSRKTCPAARAAS